MLLLLVCFGVGAGLELVLRGVRAAWPARRWLAGVSVAATVFASGGLAVWQPGLWSALIALVSLYRAFNLARVADDRMHERYLRHAAWRTAVILAGAQVAVAGLWLVWQHWPMRVHTVWVVLASAQVLVAAVLLASTMRRLRHTAWPQRVKPIANADLPPISIAIPARNETEDLEACLQSVIASDYPKLEVLVLDDCSQNKRTPEIIRGFAHDGVRFIQGAPPSDTWLPKNQAYDRLAAEASGAYILFCGVDVRFAPDSIRQLVTAMLGRRKTMMSILPRRGPAAGRGQLALVQAMRYWWELVPPRRLFQRPAVLSSCWIIQASALDRAGGFAAVTRSIVPEAYFAKSVLPTDGYSFMRATDGLGIFSVKTAHDQRATAIRTRYPQLHRRPENVLAAALLELVLLVAPFVLGTAGWWLPVGGIAPALALVAAMLLTASYMCMALATRLNSWWFALVALPLMVASDVWLLHYSMWQYEFSVVDWKGRNVCIPVMHVVPHLPQLPDAPGSPPVA